LAAAGHRHLTLSTRQFARLLVLRGKVAAGLIGTDDRAAEACRADREEVDA